MHLTLPTCTRLGLDKLVSSSSAMSSSNTSLSGFLIFLTNFVLYREKEKVSAFFCFCPLHFLYAKPFTLIYKCLFYS